MQYQKVIYHNDPNTPYSQLVELLHEAFKERDEAGMNFGCSTFTADDLKKDIESGYIVVYFDEGIPIAMGCLVVKKMNFWGDFMEYSNTWQSTRQANIEERDWAWQCKESVFVWPEI